MARRYQKPDKRYSRATNKAVASALVNEEFDDGQIDADPNSITALLMGSGEKPERPPETSRVAHVLTSAPEPAPADASSADVAPDPEPEPEPSARAQPPGLLSRLVDFLRSVAASA